jgi:trk system potassium uptake protein
MNLRSILRLFGILIALYSLGFVPSLMVSLWYDDGQWRVFLLSQAITLAVAAPLFLLNRKQAGELSVRDGFLVVALFWFLLGMLGALPLLLGLHLSITDAVFESISGFTTTGATVIVGLDQLPQSILYHRQQIQWLGGMGVIVLAVAILPLLGVGGMQLYRAETSGVSKNEKMTPRIAETAKALWLIYVTLTVACAACFALAGMQPFDAIGHAFTTVATGGFSTHDASIGYYDNAAIEVIAIVFMLAGGINFALHFYAWRHRSPRPYLRDSEARAYIAIFASGTALVAVTLFSTATYATASEALRSAAFQAASILTSTGFGTATFADWPLHIPLVLVVMSFIGGCGGSTAGGIKVMRILLLAKLGLRQLQVLIHPNAVAIIKLGKRPVAEEVLYSLWGFYILYIAVALLLTILHMAAGLDLVSAFGAVIATVNLLGPGLGDVAGNFATVSDTVKWLGIIGMLIGRLEVFTLVVLLLPAFWRD